MIESIDLARQQARVILRHLQNDPGFREQIVNNPESVQQAPGWSEIIPGNALSRSEKAQATGALCTVLKCVCATASISSFTD